MSRRNTNKLGQFTSHNQMDPKPEIILAKIIQMITLNEHAIHTSYLSGFVSSDRIILNFRK